MKKVIFLMCVFVLMLGVTVCADSFETIKQNGEYIDEYEDCTVAVYDNAVWAWGGEYGESPVKILENIERLEVKSAGMYGAKNSYYAICVDKSLYVWGAHGFYTNMMPSYKPTTYTYVGGMLGLPCNYNVAPISMGPVGSVDETQYKKATDDQKTPVKLLENVQELVFGTGSVFALCENGEVYSWGNHWGNDEDKSPKLINENGKKIYVTGTSPALYDGCAVVLEKDNSLSFYGYGYGEGKKYFENVNDVCTAMYPSSYRKAVLVLTDDNVLWQLSESKITRAMDYVHAIEKKGGRIYIMQKDGTVYERVYSYSGAENTLSDKEGIFESLPVTVYVNGKMIKTDSEPYIKNDHTLVPMRAIFEALGATVLWDNETKTAEGIKEGTIVKITIGENTLYKNGQAVDLDCAAEITKGRTMVPVRAISEAFGCSVRWDEKTRCVIIENEEQLSENNKWDYTEYAPDAVRVKYYWRSKDAESGESGEINDRKKVQEILKYIADSPLKEKEFNGVWYETYERLSFSIYVEGSFGHNIIGVEVNETEVLIRGIGDDRHLYTVSNMDRFKKDLIDIFTGDTRTEESTVEGAQNLVLREELFDKIQSLAEAAGATVYRNETSIGVMKGTKNFVVMNDTAVYMDGWVIVRENLYVDEKYVALPQKAMNLVLGDMKFEEEFAISKYFDFDVKNTGAYLQIINKSISNNDYVMTVDEVVGDAWQMYIAISITAKNNQAKNRLINEEFDWVDIEGSKDNEKWFKFSSIAENIIVGDSRVILVSCDSSQYGAAPFVRVRCKKFEDEKFVYFNMEDDVPQIKLDFTGFETEGAYIIIQPMRVELVLPADDIYDARQNLDTYFRMRDGSLRTINQVTGGISSIETKGNKLYKHIFRTDSILDVVWFESVIVNGYEYSIDNAPEYTKFEVPDRLKPFVADLGHAVIYNKVHYQLPIDLIIEQTEAEVISRGKNSVEFVYAGNTYKIKSLDKKVYVNSKEAYTLAHAPHLHTDGKLWVTIDFVRNVLKINCKKISDSQGWLFEP